MIYLRDDKRAVVSITTFSLMLMILLTLFTASYFYSEISKDKVLVEYKKEELLNSMLLFRSEMLNLVTKINSTSNYQNTFDNADTKLTLSSGSISAKGIVENILVNYEISSLGLVFCSNYEFVPAQGAIFSFDGYCIRMN
jgi:hypothetical protein